MRQPAWANNNWGYDVLAQPFAGGTMYLENSLSFLQQPGQWSLDSRPASCTTRPRRVRPCKAWTSNCPGCSPWSTSAAATPPGQGLTFSGISSPGPPGSGRAPAKATPTSRAGTFITGNWQQPAFGSCFFGCQLFEATREHWDQTPAAVQVSAATNITFTGDTFSDLGQDGLGVGNDADANFSGIGLGASNITITGNAFTDDAGAASWSAGSRPTPTTRATRR